MVRPKVTVTKKVVVSKFGHFRYYNPILSADDIKALRESKGKRPSPPTFDLDYGPSDYPIISYIQTEKQLCAWLLRTWGPGEYRVIGHVKGRCGAWTFWKGEIMIDGFCFETKDKSNTGAIRALKKELAEEEDPMMKSMIQEEIADEKDDGKDTRYGFQPWLITSGRRGEFIMWQDPEKHEVQQVEEKGEAIW